MKEFKRDDVVSWSANLGTFTVQCTLGQYAEIKGPMELSGSCRNVFMAKTDELWLVEPVEDSAYAAAKEVLEVPSVMPGDIVLCADGIYWEATFCNMGSRTCTITMLNHSGECCFGVPFVDLHVVGHKGE